MLNNSIAGAAAGALAVLAAGIWTAPAAAQEQVFKDCPQCPEMVPLPGGSFLMGSPVQEPGRGEDEGPQHWVAIPDGLAAGRFEVTFDDWQACYEAGGCSYLPGDAGWGRGRNPVIHVSWHDTRQYLGWLTETTGKHYRLPTEAEWEYFARAGTATAYHSGDVLEAADANFDTRSASDLQALMSAKAVAAGQYPENAFGLSDIHGNVSEWVQDCYDPQAYQVYGGYPAAAEGHAGCRRVARGGTSHYSAAYARSANRSAFAPDTRSLDIGFRVVRAAPE